MILFSRLILLAERGEETTLCFEYELTNYPFTVFKDGTIRNCSKTSLCSFLLKGIPKANLPTEIVQVNDGEALLCQIINCFNVQSFPIFISYTKNICTANTDTPMLRLVVMETVPPQKICNIQTEAAQICPTFLLNQMKNA